MFYSILILLSGIAIGQEYTDIPSIRILTFSLLRNLKFMLKKQIENDKDNK
jgi:hypothetical protein